jgi:small subunit ribosomal protein S26e
LIPFAFLLQDKAIKRVKVTNIVEAAAIRDMEEASIYKGWSGVSMLARNADTDDTNRTFRVRPPQALQPNCVLHLVCYPLEGYVARNDSVQLNMVKTNAGNASSNFSVVRVRSAKPGAVNSRKNRAPPPRPRFKDGKRINAAVAAAQDAKAVKV